jgi:hypothetical protein
MCADPGLRGGGPLAVTIAQRSLVRLHGILGQPHRDAVRHAQVDGGHVAGHQPALGVEPGEVGHGAVHVLVGKAHVDAVLQHEVPATLGDQNGRADRTRDMGMIAEQADDLAGTGLGALADQQGQALETLIEVVEDDRAVGRDDMDAALALPEREGLALDHGDQQLVGIELLDADVGDPGIGLQARARLIGSKNRTEDEGVMPATSRIWSWLIWRLPVSFTPRTCMPAALAIESPMPIRKPLTAGQWPPRCTP